MTVYKAEIWLANLNPIKKSNEVGKIRPVLIFQNNDLNESSYPTTMVIPLTTVLIDNAEPLRLRVLKKENLKKDSDLLLTQIRAIDNSRFIEKLTTLKEEEILKVKSLLDEVMH
ncbi:MAG: type II toxin-antitoxin system PemK/MazF family toxin [Sulfurospirillum sp.]|nr:type II toxin-antitoxin system PemK/MazF family toxin [Sulfurospirillum sp.]